MPEFLTTIRLWTRPNYFFGISSYENSLLQRKRREKEKTGILKETRSLDSIPSWKCTAILRRIETGNLSKKKNRKSRKI
ncbi:hypothetical protein DLM75_11490 [Leptospira stimsonii]|uniref:Uncharacterized protein n=1 Tax=Leptospira stimsonii TaxID=2202203 RepID=A0A396Z642_9LEPT|nr:hypothetical protein DLM75_11490 [Leptospira stimsonii]